MIEDHMKVLLIYYHQKRQSADLTQQRKHDEDAEMRVEDLKRLLAMREREAVAEKKAEKKDVKKAAKKAEVAKNSGGKRSESRKSKKSKLKRRRTRKNKS